MNAGIRSIFRITWDFFCSLKLTIATLILLALTSIIGTVIQQNRTPQEYVQLYGEKLYRLFASLQFFDMYHSWWFLALLGVFCLNLIACSTKRLPRVWKAVREPVLVADQALLDSLGNTSELPAPGSVAETRDRLTTFLGQRFARAVVTERDGVVHLYAEKGGYARFGVYVTHLSILLVFVGAIIGNLWGFKAYVNIAEGTAVNQVWPSGGQEPIDLGFSVRCDDFAVSYYEGTTRPKEFMSILDIVDQGREVITDRKIIVNDPLTYQGITFYQSSYGPAGDPVARVRVTVRDTGEVLELNARQGQHVALPGGYSFAVTGYTPSYDRFGPAMQLHVNTPDGHHGKPFIVMQNYPDFDAKRGNPFSFALLDYTQAHYTGLQVKKDPGVWVVWAGCTLMVLGSIVAFCLSHRRIWVTIAPAAHSCSVRIGGTAHRNQPGFALFFDELTKNLKQELNG